MNIVKITSGKYTGQYSILTDKKGLCVVSPNPKVIIKLYNSTNKNNMNKVTK